MIRVLATTVTILTLLVAQSAHAQSARTPGTLGCATTSDVCVRLIAPLSIGGLDLVTHTVESGAFTGGMGMGLDLWASTWHRLSPGIAVAASSVSSGSSWANIAGLVGLCRYVWIGTMVHVSPSETHWFLLGGIDPLAIVGAESP